MQQTCRTENRENQRTLGGPPGTVTAAGAEEGEACAERGFQKEHRQCREQASRGVCGRMTVEEGHEPPSSFRSLNWDVWLNGFAP